MDDELSENEFIADYDGAIFRLTNVIKLMSMYKFSLSTPFEYGIGINAGSFIQVQFPHLSTSGALTYEALVTSVSLSKSSNNCNIEAVFLNDLNETNNYTKLQDTDDATTLYQDDDNSTILMQNKD
jgi:hypothetical protein